MKTLLLAFLFIYPAFFHTASGQKKYGYAVVYMRCGADDNLRNTVYFSPVIELNALNFEKYTSGIDASIPLYSVRYYNYALSKWFEIYLKEKHKVLINDPEKYLRKDSTIVFTRSADCNPDKTNEACFFMHRDQLEQMRRKQIDEAKLSEHSPEYCEIIDF